MKTYLLAALALLVPAICGCNNPAAKIHNSYIEYEGTPERFAYEFHLMDGTRCVAYGEAITCQWPVIVINPKVE